MLPISSLVKFYYAMKKILFMMGLVFINFGLTNENKKISNNSENYNKSSKQITSLVNLYFCLS